MRTLRYPRARVFTNSLADFFDNQVPVQWRREAWHVIDQTPNLDWLILTKRPQNILKMLPEPDAGYTKPWGNGWPNVWIGTTAENQEEADRRLPHLVKVPAVVHFVSVEPMLGPIKIPHDLLGWKCAIGGRVNTDSACGDCDPCIGAMFKKFLGWIICGGESGSQCRPMDLTWARALKDDCARAGVPFFFKQTGGKRKPFPPIPEDLLVRQWPL